MRFDLKVVSIWDNKDNICWIEISLLKEILKADNNSIISWIVILDSYNISNCDFNDNTS